MGIVWSYYLLDMRSQPLTQLKNCTAEAIGTFTLVFAGTGAIMVNDLSQGALTHTGISLTFGLVVMAMIYALGDISGAHLNPAVTLGFWLAGRLPTPVVVPYIGSQCFGAIAASTLLKFSLGPHATLGATLPTGGLLPAFIFEVVLTFCLMFVIFGVATGASEKGIMAGAAIGATVALCALIGGPISGASMNPARSLGPALLNGQLGVMWLYVLAPLLGVLFAIGGCRCVQKPGCCSRPNAKA